MTSFALKIFALSAMICDHIGYIFFSGSSVFGLAGFPVYIILRAVGRMSFPVYAFLIAEGFRKTSNPNKYAFRLAIFAIASEIPFDLVFHNNPLYFDSQNVFITLLFGLLSVMFYDRLVSRRLHAAAMGAVLVCALAATILRSDYQFIGVLMIFAFYVCKDRRYLTLWIAGLVAVNGATQILGASIITPNILLWGGLQIFELAALPLIYSYNGRLGPRLKYFFYAAYPLHLMIFYIIAHRLWIF